MPESARLRVALRGAVQGVGFRPFVFRLATELGLAGWVNNSNQGVLIEVEGPKPELEAFLPRLETEKPPRSSIQSLESSWLDIVGYTNFAIRESQTSGIKTTLVLPDIATCADCQREIFDPSNRRYFYPLTNCTNCGPRFSIIESLPYDRANTSMKQFKMCSLCQLEYDKPLDRRFHAQPNACPACGPHLELWGREGGRLFPGDDGHFDWNSGKRSIDINIQRSFGHSTDSADGIGLSSGSVPAPNERNWRALVPAARVLLAGKILAVKGLGGFHLMVLAHDDYAVSRLRELKHREEKPFALMFPNLAAVKTVCEVSSNEERLLRSAEAPIVLLRAAHVAGTTPGPDAIRQSSPAIAPSVAPGNPQLGVLLPYTPLHHLLLHLVAFPVVATSGNLSDEPICVDEQEALQRLGAIADFFLVHNRPIVRHVDDSIVRIMAGREQVLRRARGYAPLPVQLQDGKANLESVLAVGAHLKNTVAFSVGSQVFISQHIGDLETEQANRAFRNAITDFELLYEHKPAVVAADSHPDYVSTKFAQKLCQPAPGPEVANGNSIGKQVEKHRYVSVQHHLAHILSCAAENEVQLPALGIALDGAGYGLDGTVWGGEFLWVTEDCWKRVGHFRRFPLPGGEAAIKEPRRAALGLLFEMLGEEVFSNKRLAPMSSFSPAESASLKRMLQRGLNAPMTSSTGRLFDAVASLTGLRQKTGFEGQAAMDLEFAIAGLQTEESYPIRLVVPAGGFRPEAPGADCALQLDWSPLIQQLLSDLASQTPLPLISARFHNALVEGIVQVASRCASQRVILTGGCFQNRYLTERAVQRLAKEGFNPYWHQRVPPNDGGISLGQVVAALRESTSASKETRSVAPAQ